MADKRYNVVFQYTKETRGYEGVNTWTSFKDEAEFKQWYSPDIEERQRVIGQGVTQDKAIELVGQTPLVCSLRACLEEATMPDGNVNRKILNSKLYNVAFARSMSQ